MDILQALLSAIFRQQVEEENNGEEQEESIAQRHQTVPEQVGARDVARWCKQQYGAKLRLPFLTSDAQSVNGRSADAGLRLVHDYPLILLALRSHSVYQLPLQDIVQILCCLIHQLLSYGKVRVLVEQQYNTRTFGHDPDTEPNALREVMFVQHLLKLEGSIRDGNLGVLRVHEDSLVYPLHYSDKLRMRMYEQACALLQVAQSIEQKFLRHPFAPKQDNSDRSTIVQTQTEGYVQCYYTYYLKPKLEEVPPGYWYCMHCRLENSQVNEGIEEMQERKRRMKKMAGTMTTTPIGSKENVNS